MPPQLLYIYIDIYIYIILYSPTTPAHPKEIPFVNTMQQLSIAFIKGSQAINQRAPAHSRRSIQHPNRFTFEMTGVGDTVWSESFARARITLSIFIRKTPAAAECRRLQIFCSRGCLVPNPTFLRSLRLESGKPHPQTQANLKKDGIILISLEVRATSRCKEVNVQVFESFGVRSAGTVAHDKWRAAQMQWRMANGQVGAAGRIPKSTSISQSPYSELHSGF